MIVHPTVGWGGAEKTTLNIVEALSKNSFRVALTTNQERFQNAAKSKTSLMIDSFSGWFGTWSDIVKDIRKLARIIKIIKPQVVLAMMPYGCFLTSLVRFFSQYRYTYIASPRGSAVSYLRNFVPERYKRLKYRIFF